MFKLFQPITCRYLIRGACSAWFNTPKRQSAKHIAPVCSTFWIPSDAQFVFLCKDGHHTFVVQDRLSYQAYIIWWHLGGVGKSSSVLEHSTADREVFGSISTASYDGRFLQRIQERSLWRFLPDRYEKRHRHFRHFDMFVRSTRVGCENFVQITSLGL